MGYRKNPDWEWEESAAAGLVGLALVVAIVVAAILITLLVILLKELGRVYLARAFEATRTARILWFALAGLLGAWLVAGLLATSSATLSLALSLAAWSFLAFVLVVEGCDWYAGCDDRQALTASSLEDVLGGWPGEPAPLSNGQQPEPINSVHWERR